MSASLSDLDALIDLFSDRIAARVIAKLQEREQGHDLIGIAEASTLSGAGERRIRDAGRRGEIELFRAGRQLRVRRSDLIAWAEKHARTPVRVVCPNADGEGLEDDDDAIARHMGLRVVKGGCR